MSEFSYSLTDFLTRVLRTIKTRSRCMFERASSVSLSSASTTSTGQESSVQLDVAPKTQPKSNKEPKSNVESKSNKEPKSNKAESTDHKGSEEDQLNHELSTNQLDPNSFARSSPSLRVSHLHLSLFIDFHQKLLEGFVRLSVSRKSSESSQPPKLLLLDTYELEIQSVTLHLSTNGSEQSNSSQKKLPFKLHRHLAKFGSKLEVEIGQVDSKHSEFGVEIKYQTKKDGTKALTWMEAEQTDAKRQPFMFTQCEPNYARTMLPCQDTPGVKTTFSAEISVDNPHITVLMSGVEKEPRKERDGRYVFHYCQKVPIPSYLIAIVAGDLVSAKISARSKVWSENYTPESTTSTKNTKSNSSSKTKSTKSLIERVAWEFAQIEEMLHTAESIVGPYEFVRYDLLVLPSSFAFGGMENPCLTFVSNTLLAGDRSLVSVVAHEIAHSWFGNLVTNRNFEHFWLNEGFTTFLERKIVDRCCSKLGPEIYRHFAAIDGLQDMTDDIEKFLSRKKEFATSLVVDLKGHEPEEAFSRIPYDKGHTFLFYLEELVGGPRVFDPFLKQYVHQYRLKSIDTDTFRQYFMDYFHAKSDRLDQIDWKRWLHGTGMPPHIPHYNQKLLEQCRHLAKVWIEADFQKFDNSSGEFPSGEEPPELDGSHYRKLLPKQRRCFFNELRKIETETGKKLEVKRFKKLYHNYQLEREMSLEIRTSFVLTALDIRSEGQVEDAFRLIQETGRMKYVVPVYRGLYVWEKTRSRVINYFKQNRKSMMEITAEAIARELEIAK